MNTSTPTIQELIERAKNLPPSPQILPRLLTLLQDEESTNWEIAQLIHLDQSLTSQILTWSNSGYYGYLDKSADVEEAVSRVGMSEIYKLVGIIMSKRLLNQPSEFYALDPGQLWENSMAAAFAMETLASKVDEDSTLCYTIGLLHAIGKIVINQACDCYEAVFKEVEVGKTLIESEESVIGYNHAQVGEALLEKWQFPKSITEPIGLQYVPMRSADRKPQSCLMNLTHVVVASIGQGVGREGMAFAVHPEAMEVVGIEETELQMVIVQTQEKLELIKTQLQMA